jgi:hypothetical protein
MRKTTIITDPIHHVMNLGSDPKLRDVLKQVMDTRTFQRLRRITQLGLTSYVFPGATHTRFSHSLGVTYLAYSVLTHLQEWASEGEGSISEDLPFNEVMLAALLHDVGHGPFSHSFEQVLKSHGTFPLHEDWTATLITHQKSDIHAALERHTIDIGKVASVFTKSDELARPYRQIVSSQIDVDRMDYLVRDSHFAGVAIGRFDAQYLINSIVIVPHGEGGPETLGITLKGVKAYEAFLIARQLMNRTVYYHHNVKVLEFMIEHLLRLVIEHMNTLLKSASIAPFIPAYFWKVGAKIESGGSDLHGFMADALNDYVRLTEDAVWNLVTAIADNALIPELKSLAFKIMTRAILLHFEIEEGKTDLLREILRERKLIEGTDFFVLSLKTTMYKRNGDERVFVVDWEGDIEEVAAHSETISAFRDRPEAESLLIVINEKASDTIRDVGRNMHFLIDRKMAPERSARKRLVRDLKRTPT